MPPPYYCPLIVSTSFLAYAVLLSGTGHRKTRSMYPAGQQRLRRLSSGSRGVRNDAARERCLRRSLGPPSLLRELDARLGETSASAGLRLRSESSVDNKMFQYIFIFIGRHCLYDMWPSHASLY
jgi:hypothetical protein